MHQQFHQHALRDVIADAQHDGWRIEVLPGGLSFVSPDDDALYVSQDQMDESEVAHDLHNLDSHHFPEEWSPVWARLFVDLEGHLDERERGLREQLEQVRAVASIRPTGLPANTGALTMLIEEARALGWAVVANHKQFTFTRDSDEFQVPLDANEQLTARARSRVRS